MGHGAFDLHSLTPAKTRQLMQALGDEFWEQVDLRQLLVSLTAGLMGNPTPALRLQEMIFQTAVQDTQRQVDRFRHDPEYLAEQAARIRKVRRYRSIKKLLEIDDKDFELWTAGYFLDMGFSDILVPPKGRDTGVDVFLETPDHHRAIVQCKQYTHPVQRNFVDQFYTTMHEYKVCLGYMVTTTRFTEGALNFQNAFGKKYQVVFIDGAMLTSKEKVVLPGMLSIEKDEPPPPKNTKKQVSSEKSKTKPAAVKKTR